MKYSITAPEKLVGGYIGGATNKFQRSRSMVEKWWF